MDHADRGPRVDRGRIRHRGGLAGEVLGRGREVALAQRDQGDQAPAEGSVTGCLPGGGHRLLRCGGGLAQAAPGQVETGIQDREHCVRGYAPQPLAVDGPEHLPRFIPAAQISQHGRQDQQRLDMASIRGHAAAPAARLMDKLKPVADLPRVPGDQRPGDQRRCDDLAAVLIGPSQYARGYPVGRIGFWPPSQRLQLRHQRHIAHVRRQARAGGGRHPSDCQLAKGLSGSAGAQCNQPVLRTGHPGG